MIYTVGIDAGSRALKIVIIDQQTREIVDSSVTDPGVDHKYAVEKDYLALLERNRIGEENIARVIATGYGRNIQEVTDETVTEITCHAKGVYQLVPDARTVIEIGGQDSKVLHLHENGNVADFSMNDRCAAGTGRFMEIAAQRLDLEFDQLPELLNKSVNPVSISSMCVVFAETEIIGLLAEGVSPADIISGIQKSVASRISAMIGRNYKSPVYFTGGVAMVPGMRSALERVLEQEIGAVNNPQITGALGAALIAANRC